MLLKATYAVPALAGYGDHWYLTEDEAKALSEQAEASIGALPASKLAAISRIVATWAPVAGFVVTTIIVTKVRVDETRRLNAAARSDKGGSGGQPPEASVSSPAGNGAGTGKAPGTVTGRRAELFREREG